MRFSVGPWVYRVRVVAALKDEAGKPAAGLCVWKDHVIWLSGDMPVRRRLEVLLHELKHAWQLAMGRPEDDEGDASQSASFAADVLRQLERQGGEAALMRLNAEGVVDVGGDVEVAGEPRAAQCPACSGLLSLPIRTAVPEFDPARNRLLAARAADCEFCSHTVTWREAVTSSGVPTGHVVGEPVIASGSLAPSA